MTNQIREPHRDTPHPGQPGRAIGEVQCQLRNASVMARLAADRSLIRAHAAGS